MAISILDMKQLTPVNMTSSANVEHPSGIAIKTSGGLMFFVSQ